MAYRLFDHPQFEQMDCMTSFNPYYQFATNTVSFATEYAAALDVAMPTDGTISIGQNVINLGTSLLHCDDDVCFQICLRSSWGFKGLFVHPGIIDSDYMGPIKAIIFNTTGQEHHYKKGDRICQLLPVFIRRDPYYVNRVQRTGGFGSTT